MSNETQLAIKTGLSVGLALFIGKILKIDSLFYAGIAAAICSQVEVKATMKQGLGRISGTIVGAFLGILIFYNLPHNVVVMGTGVTIIVYISYKYLKIAQANIASIVFLGILLENTHHLTPFSYFFHRVLDTSLGVVIAVFVSNIRLTKNS